jgi:predicted lipoprotein with Yx(FWY)xxD motif
MRKPVASLMLMPLALVLVVSACSSDQTTPEPSAGGTPPAAGTQVGVADTKLGKILTDANGRTLYAFTVDKGGKSACYQQCAKAWPALTPKGEPTVGEGLRSSLLGTTTRTDGTAQVTYKGMPLYHFAGDTKPSDTNGQGLNKVWWVIAPDGSLVKSAP